MVFGDGLLFYFQLNLWLGLCPSLPAPPQTSPKPKIEPINPKRPPLHSFCFHLSSNSLDFLRCLSSGLFLSVVFALLFLFRYPFLPGAAAGLAAPHPSFFLLSDCLCLQVDLNATALVHKGFNFFPNPHPTPPISFSQLLSERPASLFFLIARSGLFFFLVDQSRYMQCVWPFFIKHSYLFLKTLPPRFSLG